MQAAIETSPAFSVYGLCRIWGPNRDDPIRLRSLLYGFFMISGEPSSSDAMLEIEFLIEILTNEIMV